MVDFTRYQPPGVYVDDTNVPLVTTTGVPVSIVCIIGAALGYQTWTEVLTINHTTAVQLSKRGAWMSSIAGGTAHNSSSIAAPVVTNYNTGAAMVEGSGSDYTFSYDTSQSNGDVTQGIANITSSVALTGTKVVVAYRYTDSSYYLPSIFSDYETVTQTYGMPTVVSSGAVTAEQANAFAALASQVTTPLSMAAKVAFENGANQIIALALNPGDGSVEAQFQTAYTKIAADNRINIVVPVFIELTETSATTSLANVTSLAQDLQTALNLANTNGIGRIGIFGTSKNFDVSPGQTDDFVLLAQALNEPRIVLAYPHQLNYFNAPVNQTTVVDGAYLAAAYGGILSSIPVNKALTKEIVNSFSGIPASLAAAMTLTFKNTLSQNGVAVSETNNTATMTCRHGVSTAPGNILTREPSITRQRDALFQLVQSGLDAAGLVGQPITSDTPISIKGVISGILETATNNGVIINYSNLLVRQQALPSGDPSAIEVQFAYLPAIPLNYVVVTFSIDLTNGLAILTSTAA